MIDITIACVPPSTTSQMKRVAIIAGKPRFFQPATLRREAETWAALLTPHVPAAPLTGPVLLFVALTYPHLASTRKRDRPFRLRKVSKPDAGNAAKHLEDTLVRLRFLEDDQQVARLTIEKWHGPETRVGIQIRLTSLPLIERPVATTSPHHHITPLPRGI